MATSPFSRTLAGLGAAFIMAGCATSPRYEAAVPDTFPAHARDVETPSKLYAAQDSRLLRASLYGVFVDASKKDVEAALATALAQDIASRPYDATFNMADENYTDYLAASAQKILEDRGQAGKILGTCTTFSTSLRP